MSVHSGRGKSPSDSLLCVHARAGSSMTIGIEAMAKAGAAMVRLGGWDRNIGPDGLA